MRKLFVVLAAVVLAVAFTAPARADVSFYGHVLFETYMVEKSAPPGGFDDSDLSWTDSDGDTRFGARFKDGDFSANIEIRSRLDTHERQWNASWNFGAGILTIGHTWAPGFSPICGWARAPGSAGGYGDPGCSVREDMIKLTFGAFEVAALKPYTSGIAAPPPPAGPGPQSVLGISPFDADTSIPKIEARYNLKAGPASIKIFGGYQTYDEVDPSTDVGVGIDSYIFGANVSVGFGPGYVKAMYWMGQNIGTYAPFPYPNKTCHGPYWDGTSLTDSDNSAYEVVVGYNISDTMKIDAGYLTAKTENDTNPTYREDENAAYYVTLPIKVAKNFTITPEIIFNDDKDYVDAAGVSHEQGDTTYYGAAWKITF